MGINEHAYFVKLSAKGQKAYSADRAVEAEAGNGYPVTLGKLKAGYYNKM